MFCLCCLSFKREDFVNNTHPPTPSCVNCELVCEVGSKISTPKEDSTQQATTMASRRPLRAPFVGGPNMMTYASERERIRFERASMRNR